MSRQVKAFILGFTNAFRPVRYSDACEFGDIANSINKRFEKNRRETIGKIDKSTKKNKETVSY